MRSLHGRLHEIVDTVGCFQLPHLSGTQMAGHLDLEAGHWDCRTYLRLEHLLSFATLRLIIGEAERKLNIYYFYAKIMDHGIYILLADRPDDFSLHASRRHIAGRSEPRMTPLSGFCNPYTNHPISLTFTYEQPNITNKSHPI